MFEKGELAELNLDLLRQTLRVKYLGKDNDNVEKAEYDADLTLERWLQRESTEVVRIKEEHPGGWYQVILESGKTLTIPTRYLTKKDFKTKFEELKERRNVSSR